MKKVSKEVMTIGLDLIDSLKEVRLANHKISHAHALLWLINRRVRQKCQYSKNGRSFELLPGEVMSSYEAMSRAWHWDIKTVRSFISGSTTLLMSISSFCSNKQVIYCLTSCSLSCGILTGY